MEQQPTNELTAQEQQLLGFALFITAMRIGPAVFPILEAIATKTGAKMEHYARDWVVVAQTIRDAQAAGKQFPAAANSKKPGTGQ